MGRDRGPDHRRGDAGQGHRHLHGDFRRVEGERGTKDCPRHGGLRIAGQQQAGQAPSRRGCAVAAGNAGSLGAEIEAEQAEGEVGGQKGAGGERQDRQGIQKADQSEHLGLRPEFMSAGRCAACLSQARVTSTSATVTLSGDILRWLPFPVAIVPGLP
ncbi:MAG: hypothetical protein ACK4TJ_08580 [Tabrizicola sp.]